MIDSTRPCLPESPQLPENKKNSPSLPLFSEVVDFPDSGPFLADSATGASILAFLSSGTPPGSPVPVGLFGALGMELAS